MKPLEQIGKAWHYVLDTLATPLLVKASEAPIWRVFFLPTRIWPFARRRKYLKPPLTYEQQITLLESRGLLIDDRPRAVRWLSRTNYYRFSAYLFPFRNPDDTYKPGTNLDTICRIYNFDRKLRLLVMDAIERVEIWLRTALTYEMAHHGGPFAYIRRAAFTKGFDRRSFMKTLKDEQRRSSETFVAHYMKTYDGEKHLPIWMATELLTLGTLSHLYSGLPLQRKKNVAALITVDEKVLSGWLHNIAYIRNICAHHSRLWNRTLAIRARCPKRWAYGKIDNSRLYLSLVIFQHIMSKIAPGSKWGVRLQQLIDSSASIDSGAMGFPADWKTKEPWRSLTL